MNLQYPLQSQFHSYNQIQIIRCRENRVLIIGWSDACNQYGVLVIYKIKANESLQPLSNIIYPLGPFNSYLRARNQIDKQFGSSHLKDQISAYGIIGFYSFLQGYYLMYISQIEPIAQIGRHTIMEIQNTNIISLFENRSDDTRKDEQRYLQMLKRFKLQKYYFSNTYDLTNCLAKNMIKNTYLLYNIEENNVKEQQSIYSNYHDMNGICELFHYNYQTIKEVNKLINNKRWIIPIIHGFCQQFNVKYYGNIFNIIVIARRSRHHAGARYIKRGINSNGFAANFVQIQQIVVNYSLSQNLRPICSSFVQVRGSVPTYWMQRPSMATAKPDIQIRNDDYLYLGTRKHFRDMYCRYGDLLFCVNLMKQVEKIPRQSKLSAEYRKSVKFINRYDIPQDNKIHYVEIDMKSNIKLDKPLFFEKIRTLTYYTLLRTGIFMCTNYSISSHQQYIELQNGVVRANCVDCLDRTNFFQQLVGSTALAYQLARLMQKEIKLDELILNNNILHKHEELYKEMGDIISIQYGSSLAHQQNAKTSKTKFKLQDLFIAMQRHFNNNMKDPERQSEIDLFLGFKPENKLNLWDLKPSIQHYPSKQVQGFQHYQWYPHAQQYFIDYFNIGQLQSLNQKQTKNHIMVEKCDKEELVNIFGAKIVNSLILHKNKAHRSVIRFVIMQKIFLKHSIRKEMNPINTSKIVPLSIQLKYPHNKMDFISQDVSTSSNNLRRDQNFRKNSAARSKFSTEINEIQKQSQIIQQTYLNDVQYQLSQQQIELIQKTIQGKIVDETDIEKLITQLYQYLNGDQINENWISTSEYFAQLNQIKNGIINHQYLNFKGLSKNWQRNTSTKKQPKQNLIINPKKKQLMRQNRMLILKQTMKTNFSHGNIHKITQV